MSIACDVFLIDLMTWYVVHVGKEPGVYSSWAEAYNRWHVRSGACNMYCKEGRSQLEGCCNFSGGSNNISPGFSNFNFAFQNDVIFIANKLL